MFIRKKMLSISTSAAPSSYQETAQIRSGVSAWEGGCFSGASRLISILQGCLPEPCEKQGLGISCFWTQSWVPKVCTKAPLPSCVWRASLRLPGLLCVRVSEWTGSSAESTGMQSGREFPPSLNLIQFSAGRRESFRCYHSELAPFSAQVNWPLRVSFFMHSLAFHFVWSDLTFLEMFQGYLSTENLGSLLQFIR